MNAPAVLLRYRNRSITEEDLSFIRSTINEWDSRVLRDLTTTICTAWGWRQANGKLSLQGCQDLLLRLEDWGHIKIPRKRRRKGTGKRRQLPLLPVDLIPLAWREVHDPHADLDSLVVRPVAPEERLGWRIFMERYHYLGARAIVGEHLLYAAFIEEELVALLAWASAAFRAPCRERYIGWDEETKRRKLHLVVNNVRFLILPWVRVRHLASKVLGQNLRRLSSDWQAAWNHPVYMAETFVDTSRFRGTCYRASNWTYVGHTAGRSKRGNAYPRNGVRKALYVYELHRRARQHLCSSCTEPA